MRRRAGVLDLILPMLLALAAAYPLMLLWNDAKTPRVSAVVQSLGTICDVVWGSQNTKLDRFVTRTMACADVQAFMAANPRNDYQLVRRQVAKLSVTMPDGSVRSHEEPHIERMLHRSVKVGQRLELIYPGGLAGFDAPMSPSNKSMVVWIAVGLLTLSAAVFMATFFMWGRNGSGPGAPRPAGGGRGLATSRRLARGRGGSLPACRVCGLLNPRLSAQSFR